MIWALRGASFTTWLTAVPNDTEVATRHWATGAPTVRTPSVLAGNCFSISKQHVDVRIGQTNASEKASRQMLRNLTQVIKSS
mmetsp:Transcript_3729/g.4300  ORF Transcript_3729/g.4300 Transcript_3729/m.4300 type:complete len:82 (-) Transcript_3729:52-297(-)